MDASLKLGADSRLEQLLPLKTLPSEKLMCTIVELKALYNWYLSSKVRQGLFLTLGGSWKFYDWAIVSGN